MEDNNYIWSFTIDEITKGYRVVDGDYYCVCCGKMFTKGRIYAIGEELYDAYGAMNAHIESEHEAVVDHLLMMEPGNLGISTVQQQILKLMAANRSDKEIAKEVGIAASTVRNHRFKLREKEKQAKLYLAMMKSLEEKTKHKINQTDAGEINELHETAKMVDDRYGITAQETEKTVKTYMDETGALKQFPAKEKKKIIILREIMKNFVKDREYNEQEVNKILERIYDDYPSIRRALIEYGFLDRSRDCRVYRVKE